MLAVPIPTLQNINSLAPAGGYILRLRPNATLGAAELICRELAANGTAQPRFHGQCGGPYGSVSA